MGVNIQDFPEFWIFFKFPFFSQRMLEAKLLYTGFYKYDVGGNMIKFHLSTN
jgi:hypothetical protein